MMIPTRFLSVLVLLGLGATACKTEDPSQAVVENAFADVPQDADPSMRPVVYKVWWGVTLFDDPVLPGGLGAEQRAVPESALAYALLAPGWDPAREEKPTRFVVLASRQPFTVKRGDTVRIAVSDATFAGNCQSGQPLAQVDADFITQRIFPGELAGMTYDASTCTMTAIPPEGDGGQ